jgi:Rho-binding antiterminator
MVAVLYWERRRLRMENERYKPISCDYHDMLEAAAMHKTPVELEFDLEGVTQREKGRIADVYSADGAEFIKFDSESGPLEIRLDQIIAMKAEE